MVAVVLPSSAVTLTETAVEGVGLPAMSTVSAYVWSTLSFVQIEALVALARHVAGAAHDGLIGGMERVPERAGLAARELGRDLADEVGRRLAAPLRAPPPLLSASGRESDDERGDCEHPNVRMAVLVFIGTVLPAW